MTSTAPLLLAAWSVTTTTQPVALIPATTKYRTIPVNSERVHVSNQWDAGAFHRAIDIARRLVEYGRWDGATELWVVNAYDIHSNLSVRRYTVNDLRIVTVGAYIEVHAPLSANMQRHYEPYKDSPRSLWEARRAAISKETAHATR